MDWDRIKAMLSITGRTFGVVLLAGFLLAACGDDDDDDDTGDEPTATTEMTAPADDETPTEESEATEADEDATEADGDATEADGDATEADGDATETDGDATEPEEDGTPTEDDAEMTETEDGTPTEMDDEDGTPTEEDGEATPGETDGTATEGTAPEDGMDGGEAELGNEIEGENFTITVNAVESIEQVSGIPGVLEPESGEQFVSVNFTIVNTGDNPLPLLRTLSSMHMETADGERYDVDLTATAALLLNNEVIMDAQIEAGAEVTGAVGFSIPEEPEGLMLVVEVSDDETVEIDISGEL